MIKEVEVPQVIEQAMVEMAICQNPSKPKCPKCGSELNNQATDLIRMLIEKSALKNESGRENLGYIYYLGTGNKTVVETDCLRIDYQVSAVNADNIQMQLGGKNCYFDSKGKTSIAGILIQGPQPPNNKIGYHKSRVADAINKSSNSWKNGTNMRYLIKQ